MDHASSYPAMTRDQREYFQSHNGNDKVVFVDYRQPLLRTNTPPAALARSARTSLQKRYVVEMNSRDCNDNANVTRSCCDSASKRQAKQEHSRLPNQTHILPDNERSVNVHNETAPSTSNFPPSPRGSTLQRPCVTSSTISNHSYHKSTSTTNARVDVLSLNARDKPFEGSQTPRHATSSTAMPIFSTAPNPANRNTAATGNQARMAAAPSCNSTTQTRSAAERLSASTAAASQSVNPVCSSLPVDSSSMSSTPSSPSVPRSHSLAASTKMVSPYMHHHSVSGNSGTSASDRVRDARCAKLYRDAEQRHEQRQAMMELGKLVTDDAVHRAETGRRPASPGRSGVSLSSGRATQTQAANAPRHSYDTHNAVTGPDTPAPVFSRLYIDAQRYNQVREARERALREKQARERAMLESERTDEHSVCQVLAPSSAITGAPASTPRSRSPRRGSSASAARTDIDCRGMSLTPCCSHTSERPQVLQQLFERLSRPLHMNKKHIDVAKEAKEARVAAQRQMEESQRLKLETLLQYNWNIPAPHLSISDLRRLDEQTKCQQKL